MLGQENDVVERITLAPDAGLVESLGANHTLESAIADLVDNSVDAAATRVAVRLLTHNDRLAQVEVLDDGWGMDADIINAAMTVGYRRAYGDKDLGNFGMGLKAASFSHSDVLTVWSQARGDTPVGRRIRRADFSKDFTCEVLAPSAAAEATSARAGILGGDRGTVVVWSQVRNVYRGSNALEAREWLATRETALRAHLGVTFHRLLDTSRLEISILVDEFGEALSAPGVPVIAIDPLGYPVSGHPDYPKALIARAGSNSVVLTCHVWPPRSDITGFRIGTQTGKQFQGFYIYRHDRLLQIGGWSDAANPTTARQLARVVIDDAEAIGSFVRMNPEKSGLKFEPIFHDVINRAAAADGTTFVDYLQLAESVYVEGNRRKHRQRKAAITPEKGFAPALKKRIGSELPLIEGNSIDIKWRRFASDDFLDVDLAGKTLWLNSDYRWLFAPSGSLNDAPVLKALLYLLTHHVFEGQFLGARDRDEIALWKSILATAVATEERMRE